ncbi:hypothetical protein HYH03_005778 [Edaphochlamys debaryana]|uniref:Ankyrin repeat domain-containing protein n=1 Tax=Edaphochlamys debaryana TaxID=47281 RepID=A0A835Y7H5_9CHLO|nr:hypothetical protein HYH03_005778 [Edaphochlamys debaryana]|eukprot:KAG2496178.1 hypothetical protein HYH03_005778 [Edaphochlamys debaryana]
MCSDHLSSVRLSGAPCSASRVWIPELVDCIASFMPRNDVACNLKLVNRAAAAQLQRYATIHLSQPVPPAIFAAHWSAPDACRNLTLTKRRLLVCLTAASGVVENLAVASQAAGCRLSVEFLLSAAAAGRIECCRWLLAPGRFQPEFKDCLEAICAAARFGSLACCRWLAEHCRAFKPLPPDWRAVLEAAAASGDKAICQWCLDRSGGEAWSDAALRAALRRGHVALAEWLAALHDPQWSLSGSACLAAAAKGCDAATFRRLCEQSGSVRSMPRFHLNDILQAAVTSPTPDWRAKADLLLSLCPPGEAPGAVIVVGLTDPGTMLERLTWLQDHGFPLRGTTGVQCLAAAVEANSTEAVEWLLDAGVWPDDGGDGGGEAEGLSRGGRSFGSGPAAAGHRGRVGAFADAAEAEAVWTRAVRTAARKGHLDVLRVLAKAGCPMNVWQMTDAAAVGGWLHVVEFLVETYGTPAVGGLRSELFEAGASSGSLGLMTWLRERGCPVTPSLEVAGMVEERAWLGTTASGSEAALELLALKWRCPVPESGEPYACAVRNGDVRTLGVLRRRGVPYGRCGKGLIAAAAAARLPVSALQLLLEDGCEPESWQRAADAAARCWAPGPDRERLEAWVAAERQPARQQQREQERAQEEAQRHAIGTHAARTKGGTGGAVAAKAAHGAGSAAALGQGDLQAGPGAGPLRWMPHLWLRILALACLLAFGFG